MAKGTKKNKARLAVTQNTIIDNVMLEPVKKIIYLDQIVTMSPDKK